MRTEYKAADGSIQLLTGTAFYYDGVLADRNSNATFGRTTSGLVKRVESEIGPSHVGSGLKSITRTAYDNLGNAIEIEEPSGLRSTVSFDPQFALYPETRITYLGSTPTYSSATAFDLRFGKVATSVDLNLQVTTYQYDSRGRLICETLPGDDPAHCQESGWPFTRTTEYHYVDGSAGASYPDSLSYIETRRRHPNAPGGYLAARQYIDALGRQQFSTSNQIIEGAASPSLVVSNQVRFDAIGRISHQYPPYELAGAAVTQSPPGLPTTTSYLLNGTTFIDPLGRVGVVDPPDATRQAIRYEGKRTTTLNARNDTAFEVTNDFGHVIRRESGVGSSNPMVSSFTHDGLGHVLTETFGDSASTTIVHVYDLLGRRITTTDPDSGVWKFGFDVAGNIVYQDTPAANQSVYMCYDAMSRIQRRCISSGPDLYSSTICSSACQGAETESSYVYDSVANGSFGIGRLASVTDASGSAFFRYDSRGRIRYESKTILERTATLEYGFNAGGQPATVKYPDGDIVTYNYRSDGSLGAITSADATYVSSMHYDLYGRASRIQRGNGVVDDINFYNEGQGARLQSVAVTKAGISTPHLSLAYQYDSLGKLRQVTDNRNGSGQLANNATFEYDAVGRLKSQAGTAGGLFNYSYGYDSIGNLIQNGATTLAYRSDRPHQLETIDNVGVTYDSNGNRRTRGSHPTAGPAEVYNYDALNRIVAVHDAGLVSHATFFVYDYQSRLVADISWEDYAETPKAFYYSKLARAEDGDLVKRVFAGNLLVAERPVWAPEFSTGVTGVPEPVLIVLLVCGVLGLCMIATLPIGPLSTGRRGMAARACGIALIYFVGTAAPLVILTTPAQAQQQGSGPDRIVHQHFDHLGSTQAITSQAGTLNHQVRYDPYGRIRGGSMDRALPWRPGSGHAKNSLVIRRTSVRGYRSLAFACLIR
ncbi:MAG: RHS repeat protein [Deltaproteobacteria bacterium]|nr:RHS repeat protein [Deltaproteobacteria bacterium]